MPQHIIHIGFPKAGSTYLQHYFLVHPHINYDRMDFEHYRNTGRIDGSIINKEIKEPFRVLSEEELAVSHAYSKQGKGEYVEYDVRQQTRRTAEELKELFPDAKVIIVLRGYKSLISSIYAQTIISGGHLKFSQFIKKYGHRFVQHYNYDYIYQLYTEYFNQENVLLLPYEFLKNDDAKFIRVVEEFCRFPHIDFDGGVQNKSLPTRFYPIIRVISRFVFFLSKCIKSDKKKRELYQKYKFYLQKLKDSYLTQSDNSNKKDYSKYVKPVLPSLKGTNEIILKTKHFKGFEEYYRTI